MMSIDQVLQKLKDGDDVQLCDIFNGACLDSKIDRGKRFAALSEWLSTSQDFETQLNQLVALLTNISGDVTPNPNQSHASILATGTASTLATLGFAIHADTDSIILQVNGGTARMTLNGTNPTTSLGILLADGIIIKLSRNEAVAARFITAAGTPRLEIAAFVA
jgi:hypothetical protein